MSAHSSRAPEGKIARIVVRVTVGGHRMSATDDPVFLRLLGPSGRDFRLDFAHGKSFRRKADDVFHLGPPDAAETNVAHPELNDPTAPPLEVSGVERVALWKGLEPVPNVRGFGEMDDRLEVEEVEVDIYVEGSGTPVRYLRRGPLWLGLLCGLSFELPRIDGDG